MILVRLRHNHQPEIVFSGDEKDIIHKIHELNLCDYHDAYFYERDKFENLGLGGDEYDYYSIYEDEVDLDVLCAYKTKTKMSKEQLKQTDFIEKYLLENHIDIYCRTKRTHIKEWVLNQNKDE